MNKSEISRYPFCLKAMDQKRSKQIIKENKAEIKKIVSLRPSTPLNGKNLQNRDWNTILQNSRPSSCASIRSLKYEKEKNCFASDRRLSFEKFHKNATSNSELKLEPIVTKPVIYHRRSSCSSIKHKSDPEFVGFPPLSTENGSYRDSTNSLNEKIKEHLNQTELLDENFFSMTDSNDSSKQYFSNHSTNKYYSSESLSGIDALDDENDNEETQRLSEDLCIFFPLLEKSLKQDNKIQPEETLLIVQDVYEVLKKRNAFLAKFSHRTQLLKLLFKLLDSNYPKLSLSIIRLLLQMKVKESNLTNILRLVLKIIKEGNFDKSDEEFMNFLLENMLELSVSNNEGATMYCIRILKQLMCSDHLSMDLIKKCIVTLIHYLNKFNDLLSSGGKEWNKNHSQMIIQILSLLHHSADDEIARKLFMISKLKIQLLITLQHFYQQADLVHIALRLISKLVDKDGSETMENCSDDLILNFIDVLDFHKFSVDIILLTTFIIGNLVSCNEKRAFTFLLSSNFIEIIMDILDIYVDEHVQFKENVSKRFRNMNSSGDSDFNPKIFEVILKILCIWANICLSPKPGSYLASQDSLISRLLSIIASYVEQGEIFDTSFAICSFLVVIGNISYYLHSSSNMCIAIAERVIPLLDSPFSKEVQLESANIIRNLTRHQEVRNYIQENFLLPEFIKLLTVDDKELNTAAYGIIMNMLIDQSTHETFYQEQGITKVLQKLHLCVDRDWKTSAMMCQILWNFCNGKKSTEDPIAKMEVQHLIRFLSYFVSKENKASESKTSFYEEWKNEFLPVAVKLLDLLKKMTYNNS